MESAVFVAAAIAILAGAIGVIVSRNPVHSALMLVMTLFGIAVLFVAQDAHFLAAVQVIVYAGAIVVLFLFVIMLLGVDTAEDLSVEPIAGQRVAAGVIGLATFVVTVVALVSTRHEGAITPTGAPTVPDPDRPDVERLSEVLFTDYVLAFEVTAVLLTIAVIGAVVLVRRAPRSSVDEEVSG